jgi:electron transfer flavoprotein beta subunit
VVCFGPATSRTAIKRALSMGADEGIYISDKGIEAMDSRATAHVLAEALRRAGDFALILTGRQGGRLGRGGWSAAVSAELLVSRW